jgi:hypothetical protein
MSRMLKIFEQTSTHFSTNKEKRKRGKERRGKKKKLRNEAPSLTRCQHLSRV